jgi:hypothetical protein
MGEGNDLQDIEDNKSEGTGGLGNELGELEGFDNSFEMSDSRRGSSNNNNNNKSIRRGTINDVRDDLN